MQQQQIHNAKSTDNLSSNAFGIVQPGSTNSNKLSAHTNIVGHKKSGLIFEDRKVANQQQLHGEGHKIKRSLPDYSDILQVSHRNSSQLNV